ncbi:glutathione S-transferase family protein [Marinibacterium profundimaris]|uniref:glutathione S-transferase family protein n=1 Tax=Marinibacterium profundimaris TaxID=1679460 RepID=UPI0018EA158A|nr:glutathione S-transferase family protein [Marinibacterium profundimaris]
MKLHYAPGSRAVRVAWALEELGLDYDVARYALGSPEMRNPEFRRTHPMGRVPVLEDGGQVLFESGAIIQYLLARYGDGRLQPSVEDPEFGPYLQWFHYAEGMIMPPMNQIVVETRLLPEDRRSEVHAKRAVKLLGQMLTAVEAHMEGREFLAGAFSAADIMTGHAVIMAGRLGADMSGMPNLQGYGARLEARPAFQAAESV